jgi:nitrate/nitrite transport system permease protein
MAIALSFMPPRLVVRSSNGEIMRKQTSPLQSALLSCAIVALVLMAWTAFTAQSGGGAASGVDPEYAALMNADAGGSGIPSPLAVGRALVQHLSDPFYDAGPNDKGLGLQLAYSLARVLLGFTLAMIVGIPLGFIIGMSPLLSAALNPIIQILKPVSPLAWMPLALYTIKDSGQSAIFVIFICSIWPMLVNTAFGVASVRSEWLNVGRTLEVSPLKRALTIILPAAAPTILTGMRISIGIAWLVIVAAEMLVGGTGIGYFIWNEWNNLSIVNVIVAIFVIGVIGMILDQMLAGISRLVTFQE